MIDARDQISPSGPETRRRSGRATSSRSAKRSNASGKSLRIERVFSDARVNPFEQIEWDKRTAEITDDAGKVIFKQENVEVPKPWSVLATKVVVSKYFYGEQNTGERETSVRQLIHRVTRTIADWGIKDGYFSKQDGETYYQELTWLCLNQYGAFNSPVWFNVGLYTQYGVGKNSCKGNWYYNRQKGVAERAPTQYEYPQGSACFIQSVDDNMESIMRLAASEAMLFKFGSGTGTDISTIRSSREKLSGGGTPSGPLSFMRVYDQIAAVVKSGGKTRRAAKMQSIKDWHPDVREFIQCKAKEEKKARTLIDSGEYEANFNGEAYSSIMFQNANLSIRVSDRFMQAVANNEDWNTHWVTDPSREGPVYPARQLMREIAEGTWFCGDPGLQYETTINEWHTCKKSGPINASNPCSEYMFLDDTACNLSSINLKKMQRDDGSFDVERFRRACAIYLTAQEILVDHASYPTPTIAENSHLFRPLGLGYANLGSLLMSMGIPYDSDAGRGICGAITALLNGQGYLTSSEIASNLGTFAGYRDNEQPMLDVMQMHRDAVEKIHPACPRYLKDAARQAWNECLQSGRRYGYRNAQATVLAPTGTIAFMMDCDTTGIEPDIALVKYKQLAGGGMMKIINRTVPVALKALGYDQPEIEGVLAYIENEETIEGAPGLKSDHLPVFDCAFKAAKGTRTISWQAHVTMMAAAQPFLSGAISKTVNMPADSTVDDIELAYIEGWKLGLKALAIYRDGSKQSQPLATSKEGDRKKRGQTSEVRGQEEVAAVPRGPVRRHLAETRQSLTHKFSVGNHEGYITVGLFDDGSPGELFITMAKEGSTVGGLMDVIGTLTSLALQYGVPLKALVDKFSHMRFEPSGMTRNPDIPIAKSVPDYIFRWLGMQFIPGYREANAPQREPSGQAMPPSVDDSGVVAVQTIEQVLKEHNVPRTAAIGFQRNGVHGAGQSATRQPAAASTPPAAADLAVTSRSQQFATFQSDAPACDNCGAITVRNGNCYLCHNCGASMGCS